MENEFDYYRITISNEKSVPLLTEDDEGPRYFHKEEKINNPELMKFKLGHPIPKKPKMVDYLSTPDSVVSKKIYAILSELNIEGIQLIPAEIRDQVRNERYNNYWALHIFNIIKCVDLELSDCVVKSYGLTNVKKIVLEQSVLSKKPLENRLVFRLEEHDSYQLFHKSIVEAIMAINPVGVRFIAIEDYHDGSLFE